MYVSPGWCHDIPGSIRTHEKNTCQGYVGSRVCICVLLLLLLLSRFSRVRLCATHRQQPTRLHRPWDSPGKNTGVGCHFLLQCMKVKSLSRVRLFVTPWTEAHLAPPTGFSRQECWSGLPLPSPVFVCAFIKRVDEKYWNKLGEWSII